MPDRLALMMGGIVALLYLVGCLYRKRKPELSNFLTVFIAVTACGAAVDFMMAVYTVDLGSIPAFAGQWLTMYCGGIALIWVSVSEINKHLRDALLRTD